MEFAREVVEDAPHYPDRAPSKTTVRERNVLHWLARDWYTGAGEIVDLGSTVGGTAVPLCAGIRENGGLNVRQREGRVHCFDRFGREVVHGVWGRSVGLPAAGFVDGKAAFQYFTAPYQQSICLHAGDFLRTRWGGKPVELLHVDLAKTPELWAHVWSEFGRQLRPGRSLLIHQDFERSRLPWLTYSVGAQLPFLELVGPVVSGTVYALVKHEIPAAVHHRIVGDDFSLEEREALVDAAHHALSDLPLVDLSRDQLVASGLMKKAYCHFWFGDRRVAVALLREVPEEYRRRFPIYTREIESGQALDPSPPPS